MVLSPALSPRPLVLSPALPPRPLVPSPAGELEPLINESKEAASAAELHFWDYCDELLLDIYVDNVKSPALTQTSPKLPKAMRQNITAEDFIFDTPRRKISSQSKLKGEIRECVGNSVAEQDQGLQEKLE